MRRSSLAAAALASLSLTGLAAAQTAVIADYGSEFSYPAASVGWTYRWNANGPIGTAANYVSLVPDLPASGRYEAIDNDLYPEPPGPAGAVAATATTLVPGRGTGAGQDDNTVTRFAIAAYTIQASDLAAIGLPADGTGFLTMSDYSFAVPFNATSDGITAQMYKNDTLFLSQYLPPGAGFDVNTPGPRSGPIPLGPFQVGDTFFVAIGSDPSDPFSPTYIPSPGTDTGDSITLDYTLTLSVPEPAVGMIAAALVVGACSRRRRA